jgi:hypothetical protein
MDADRSRKYPGETELHADWQVLRQRHVLCDRRRRFPSRPTQQISKAAVPSYEYTWGLKKNVNQSEIDDSTVSATFNYTVTVTNNGLLGWMVQRVISLFKPSSMDVTGVRVTDSITDSSNSATSCPVADGVNVTVPAGSTVKLQPCLRLP